MSAPSETPHVKSLPTLARLVWRFRAYPVWSVGVLLVLLARTALEIAAPELMGEALDALVPFVGSPRDTLPTPFVNVLWMLGAVLLLRNVLTFVATYSTQRLGQDLENRFRTDLFTKVTRLHFRYHDANRSGKTIARSLRDMEKAKRFFREVAFGYVELALVAIGIVTLSYVEDWSYGIAMTAIVGVAVTSTMHFGGTIAQKDRVVSDDYDHVTTVVQENVAGARVVRAFGRETEEMVKFGGRLGTMTGGWRGLARYWTSRMPFVGAIYSIGTPVVLLIGTLRVASGTGSLGEVATVLFFVSLMKARLRGLVRLIMVGQGAVASASRVFEVLDHEEEVTPPASPATLPASGGELRVEDVWFGHREGRPILRGLSLHVPAGSSLGILGPTGSGKSTLAQLLPRHYDTDRGRILLDGIDVRELGTADLRRAIGVVFQEPFLFSATVAKNLAYGRPDASQSDLENAAKQAAAHGFVSALPDGYETVIGERGISLSGGQRQRLTIARALVMNPRVLVFDDATAAVDAITEKRLFEGIRAAAEGRTALVISQRVTSVRWCDRIAVIEEGRVTAIGTHEELVETSALYREVTWHQSLARTGS